jgi:hypothetical protein
LTSSVCAPTPDLFFTTSLTLFPAAADLAFSGKFEMVKTGEMDHPFVTDTDNAAKWGFLVCQ